MPTTKALGILLAVIVVVGGYLALTIALGIRESWAGFLFLLQWSMMEEMKLDRLPKSALGAAGGTAIAFVPTWAAGTIGAEAALVAMLAAILAAVFCLIKGTATILCNAAMMVFLTVIAIPYIPHTAAASVEIYKGLAAGVIFFGGLAAIMAAVARTRPAVVAPAKV